MGEEGREEIDQTNTLNQYQLPVSLALNQQYCPTDVLHKLLGEEGREEIGLTNSNHNTSVYDSRNITKTTQHNTAHSSNT